MGGGTGITPCMQIAAEILRNVHDEWAEKHPDRFKAHYILSDEAPEGWEASGHSKGFVGKALFEEVLYPCDDNCYNLMCGPPIMLERGCTPNLKALGHKEDNIFAF